MVRVHATCMFIIVLLLAVYWPVVAAQTETQTPNVNTTLEKVTRTVNTLATWLQRIAYIVLVAAAFVGVINYVFGKGPEWLTRAAVAAIAVAVVLWIISQVFPS